MNEDEDAIALALKRSSADKLAWKIEIADATRDCRKTKGTFRFRYMVEALEDIIYVNIPGYHLSPEIDNIKKLLDKLRSEKIEMEKREKKRFFYSRPFQAKFKIKVSKWYWNTYYKKLIQLLAEHNLLLETQKYVKIKEVGKFGEHNELMDFE